MDTKNNSGNQFYLNIRYDEHHSWQGSLQRLDTGETINFRSELELMHLMEAATSKPKSNHEKQKHREWKNSEEDPRQIFNIKMKNGTTGA